MTIRVRFAPSPTGNVHIGNIRAAIFNWLFARHEDGRFLLRVEDTDRERSTPEAVRTLLDALEWLRLTPDEPPLFQSSRATAHLALAERLVTQGKAYRSRGERGEAVVFRIPWEATAVPGVHRVETVEWSLYPDVPLRIDATGIRFALISRKGKPVQFSGCLAGFRDLDVLDASGAVLFQLEPIAARILAGDESVRIDTPGRIRFTRHEITFTDIVKGELSKPLDSMKDLVIVRGDGSAVFHLANVCDDLHQKITHIVRGDDHVENTYRHLFLYDAIGASPPAYAHLPMIVNAAGKPYSKRDGDAFVGEFREKGFLPEALFNYLSLLGWSPGNDQEKLTRDELVSLFSLDRVQRAPAQVDMAKLRNLNGHYMAELDFACFLESAREVARGCGWGEVAGADPPYFDRIARLLQSRTKVFAQVCEWDYFFCEIPQYDEKACRKFLRREGTHAALQAFAERAATISFTLPDIETAVCAVTRAAGIPDGRLNQPLRVAVTGRTVGAGIYETLEVLGRDRVLQRLDYVLKHYGPESETPGD